MTIEPSASGIAATASATAYISELMMVSNAQFQPLCAIESTKTSAQIIIMIIASTLENLSRLCCRGVFFSFAEFIRSAILTISVFMHVPVTGTSARP